MPMILAQYGRMVRMPRILTRTQMTMVSKLMLRVGIVTKKQRQSLLIREYVRQQQQQSRNF